MMLTPGTILQNRYEIIRIIGQGGMGAVYEAKDQSLGHSVAVKQMLVSGTLLQQAFEGEARMLARLRHTALPNVSHYFIEANSHFLVMEYIPGDDLESLLRRQGGPLPVEQVLEWGDQLLDVLEYLHSHQPPIIHRDIKPANIKLSSNGKIILLDFGLSKGGKTSNSRITLTGASIPGFTPHYAPLEQIEGTGTDERRDLYALAATLHGLLTGAQPPTAITRARAQIMQTADPLRPANELNPQVPADVATLLTQAMALLPSGANHRPASAKAMRTTLRTAAHQKLKPAALQQAPSTSPPLLALPKRAPILIGALLVLVMLIGGAILWPQPGNKSAAIDFTATPTTTHTLPTSTETRQPTPTSAPATATTTKTRQPSATVTPTSAPTTATTTKTRQPSTTATAQGTYTTYTVMAGDTLYSIAEKHHTTIEELRALNNLTTSFIYVDQVLKVPTEGQAIPPLAGTPEAPAAEAPAEEAPSATEEVPDAEAPEAAPEGGTIIHTVQQGEWIYPIARQYGVSPEAIMQANNLSNPNTLYPGQQLVIPQ